MKTAIAFCEEELQYTVSFRQPRRVEREDVPPPGRFETTSSARLARAARHRRGQATSSRGFCHRGTARAVR